MHTLSSCVLPGDGLPRRWQLTMLLCSESSSLKSRCASSVSVVMLLVGNPETTTLASRAILRLFSELTVVSTACSNGFRLFFFGLFISPWLTAIEYCTRLGSVVREFAVAESARAAEEVVQSSVTGFIGRLLKSKSAAPRNSSTKLSLCCNASMVSCCCCTSNCRAETSSAEAGVAAAEDDVVGMAGVVVRSVDFVGSRCRFDCCFNISALPSADGMVLAAFGGGSFFAFACLDLDALVLLVNSASVDSASCMDDELDVLCFFFCSANMQSLSWEHSGHNKSSAHNLTPGFDSRQIVHTGIVVIVQF